MDHQIIKQIVEEVFKKVMPLSASHKKNPLSHKIEESSKPRISYKTAERAYEKYIDQVEMEWSPNRVSVNNFCKFLEYNGYEEYVKKNFPKKPKTEVKDPALMNDPNVKEETTEIGITKDDEKSKKRTVKKKWVLMLKITIVLGMLLLSYLGIRNYSESSKSETVLGIECMAWAKDHYEKIDCDLPFHPKYGTKLERLVPERIKAMRKIEIDASTPFFDEETKQPLVWYYKNKNNKLEYFASPGLHPINGETLKKITPDIIVKYVPIHRMNKDSFIKDNIGTSVSIKDTIVANVGFLILDQKTIDEKATSKILDVYFKGNKSNFYLRNQSFFNRKFINSFASNTIIRTDTEVVKVDTICLGISNYSFEKTSISKDRIKCIMNIKLDIYIRKNETWLKIKNKLIDNIGLGYSEQEAKSNAINKIYYE